jgi:membrane protein
MRRALEVMFVMPTKEQPNFVVGKATDLAVLLVIGFILLVSVGLSALVSGFSERLIDVLGFDPDATVPLAVLRMVAHGMAILASTVLLLAMFRLLARPHLPRAALLWGALLGAVGFELLKAVANQLLGLTQGKPAFQAFGVALILLVWINYFSRLVMLAAAWAYTARASSDRRRAESLVAPAAALRGPGAVPVAPSPVAPSPVAPSPVAPALGEEPVPVPVVATGHRGRWAVVVAGGGLGLAALWAWLRRAGA